MAKQNMRKAAALFPQRSVLTFMALTGLVHAYMMRQCFNIEILKLVNDTSDNPKKFQHTKSTMMDGTQIVKFFVSDSTDRFYWSEETKGRVMFGFFIGYAALLMAGSFFGQKYGGKTILNLGLFLIALCTMITPTVMNKGVKDGLIMLRFFVSICEAIAYPSLIVLLSCWIPESERGRVSSMVFCGGHIGSIISNLMTGLVPQYIEVYATRFEILGIVGIVWSIAFHFLVYNTPAIHPRISSEEKEHLRNAVGNLLEIKSFFQIPWTSMLSSPPVLALLIVQMGHDWVFYILAYEIPKYLETILGLNYEELAVYTSIPFCVSILLSVLCGIVCDYSVSRKLVTVTRARKVFTIIGVLGPAIFTVLSYYEESNRVAAVIYLTLAMGSMGSFYTGAHANLLDLCPNYSGALMGLFNGTGAICGFLAPCLTGKLTKNSQYWEWEAVFHISFVILSTTLIFYLVWGSAEVQSWNDNVKLDRVAVQEGAFIKAGVD